MCNEARNEGNRTCLIGYSDFVYQQKEYNDFLCKLHALVIISKLTIIITVDIQLVTLISGVLDHNAVRADLMVQFV